MAGLDGFAADVFALLKEETKDLWGKEDEEFLRQLAEDVAREKRLALASPGSHEHADNLRLLAATLKSRMAAKRISLNQRGQEVFERVLATAIRVIAMEVLKA